jgi:hypothetical protein
MINAASRCDIVVSSGGVSMGEADLVKPLLQELGEVFVINMMRCYVSELLLFYIGTLWSFEHEARKADNICIDYAS